VKVGYSNPVESAQAAPNPQALLAAL